MDEAPRETCRVIYFCPHSALGASRLFHRSSPPQQPPATPTTDQGPLSLHHVYTHVHMLLDEDMGGFEQVYVSPRLDECLEQVTSSANISPTAVLVESRDVSAEGTSESAIAFLNALTERVQGAFSPFPQKVMIFVLLVNSISPSSMYQDPAALLDATTVRRYHDAGALDTISSPLDFVGLDRLVGRVKENIRPPAQHLGSGMTRGLWQSIADQSKPRLAAHRPDERISPERKTAIELAIRKWRFPAHEFDMDELTYGALFMLEHVLHNPCLEAYRLSRAEMMTFLLATRRQYRHEREVQYHNWRHAVDVTQSLYCFLCDLRLCPLIEGDERRTVDNYVLEQLITPIDALTLLVSAIGHDVGHPGVNNAFLVACSHSLAHLYNDKSVLENYHCATYTQILRRHWPSLGTITSFRNNMISTILATDMQRHFEYMSQLDDLTRKVDRCEGRYRDWSDKEKDQTRDLLMSLLIKAADISNIARPFEIAAQWAQILMNEFARQGELESELRIPTCLFGGPPDREDQLAAAQSQKGFMNLFGFPLFRGIVKVMPSVSCTMLPLETNKSIWEKKIDDERSRREAVGDGRPSPRTYAMSKDNVELARRRKRESEPETVPSKFSNPSAASPHRRLDPTPLTGADDSSVTDLHRHSPPVLAAAAIDPRRTSAPLLGNSLAVIDTSSRRSSKDVALNQLHELNMMAQQALHNGSRRGSADAGWQIHTSRPTSRRASKDESLTTILVASQGSPSPRTNSNPSSPALRPNDKTKAGVLGGGVAGANRHHVGVHGSVSQSPSPTFYAAVTTQTTHPRSHPPSRSQTVSSAADTAERLSPSTQPSSLALTEDDLSNSDATHRHNHQMSQNNTQSIPDAPGPWPKDTEYVSSAAALQKNSLVNPSTTTPYTDTVSRSPQRHINSLLPSHAISPIDPLSGPSPPTTTKLSSSHHQQYNDYNNSQPRQQSNGLDNTNTIVPDIHTDHTADVTPLGPPSLILSPTKSNATTAPSSSLDPRDSSSSSPRLRATITSQTTAGSEDEFDSSTSPTLAARSTSHHSRPLDADSPTTTSSAPRPPSSSTPTHRHRTDHNPSDLSLSPISPSSTSGSGSGSGTVHQSRSRSRLRGLKFWLKRRDAPGNGVSGAGEGERERDAEGSILGTKKSPELSS